MDSRKSSLSNFDTVSLQTEELTKLVCPVCYEYMKPPIMECENGHGICEFCHDLLTECPVCQSSLPHRRSSHLETLSQLVLYPCKKCGSKVSLTDLTLHECAEEKRILLCLVGQVYGECTWTGYAKDMVEHCRIQHPLNYWTQFENATKWCCCTLSNIGVQNIYIIDSFDAMFIIVQKFDSNSHSLQWHISCEAGYEKFYYEIRIVSENSDNVLISRSNIKNEENIVTFLPSDNEIVIPVHKLSEFLTKDEKYIYYKVIIHKGYNTDDNFNSNSNETEGPNSVDTKTCLQKTWGSIIYAYNTIKRRLFCSK